MFIANHRRSERRDISVLVLCRSSWRKVEGTLSNISPEGCCIMAPLRALSVGQQITVRLQSSEALAGRVQWVDEERVGIEFERPLYLPVYDHLVRTHSGGRR